MAVRRSPRARREPTPALLEYLAIGLDFFGSNLGQDLDALRAAWGDPSVREAVYDWLENRNARQPPNRQLTIPWAAAFFDGEADPEEIRALVGGHV